MVGKTFITGKLSLLAAVILTLSGCARPYEFGGTAYEPPRPMPTIGGVNWDGRAFRSDELRGKVVLVFFGYTHCPDVCPLTLAQLARVQQMLGDQADEVAVVFVTTDPVRDTPERLGDYVPAFNSAFYGVYVPAEGQASLKAAYGVFAEPEESVDASSAGSGAAYEVAHTSGVFLADKDGRLRVYYSGEIAAERLAPDVQHLLSSD